MNWRILTLLVVGIALTGLGVLWLLQGVDAVHVRPILCISNCKPVTSGSGSWLAVGIVALIVGMAAAALSARHLHRHPR